MDWADPVRETTYRLRRLFVRSLDDRRAARPQRAKDLARARRALWQLQARLWRPAYRQRTVVQRKVAAAVAKGRPFMQVEVVETSQGLARRWRLDRRRLREEATVDGLYCLLAAPAQAYHQPDLRRHGRPVPLRADRARGPPRGPGDRPRLHWLVDRRAGLPASHRAGPARRVRAAGLGPATTACGHRSPGIANPHADRRPSPDPRTAIC